MNLSEVIQKFEHERNGKFSPSDVDLISHVATELGLEEFDIKMRDNGPIYFYDTSDCLHVHRTMIVASRSFSGSTDRGPKPYEKWPHHIELSQWNGRSGALREKSGIKEFLCNNIWVPVDRECSYCGEIHSEDK